MLIIECGIVTCCKDLQRLKAKFPMHNKESGMMIFCRSLHHTNARSQIISVPLLIMYVASFLFSHLNNLFPSSLYITPHSSFTPIAMSMSVTLVDNTTSIAFDLQKVDGFIFCFCFRANIRETTEKKPFLVSKTSTLRWKFPVIRRKFPYTTCIFLQ